MFQLQLQQLQIVHPQHLQSTQLPLQHLHPPPLLFPLLQLSQHRYLQRLCPPHNPRKVRICWIWLLTITFLIAHSESTPVQSSTNLLAEHSNSSAECNCTIQIRMPSNTIKVCSSQPILRGRNPNLSQGFFRPTDTLRTVHQYVNLHLEPKKEFVLVTTFPKKTYSGEQLDLTLKQAGMDNSELFFYIHFIVWAASHKRSCDAHTKMYWA